MGASGATRVAIDIATQYVGVFKARVTTSLTIVARATVLFVMFFSCLGWTTGSKRASS